MNNPYNQNPAESSRPSRGKLWRIVAIVVVALIVLGGGFLFWQQNQRAKNQTAIMKSANELYADDPRYVSFGADYLFAVPKSYSVNETSLTGVQLLIPSGVESAEIDNFDKLFDAAILAVQPVTEITANSNKDIKKYIDDVLVPDLKKEVSEDIKVTYSYIGKYKAATVVVNKDGRQVRQIHVSGGSHPFTVVAQTKSDAFVQIVNTLIGLGDSTNKAAIELIKEAVKSNIATAQANKAQELFDGSAAEFKKESTVKDITAALNTSSAFLKRNIVVPGGTLKGDLFVGQLSFPPATKEEGLSLGTIGLRFEEGSWKINSFALPSASAPAATKKQ